MRINRKVLNYIKKNNIVHFRSKNPSILCLKGKYASNIREKLVGSEHKFQCWESFHNNKWTTFIKDTIEGD